MTSDFHLFSTFSTFLKPIKITLADKRLSPTIGKGIVHLSPDLILEDFLLVPSIPTGLLSISKLYSTKNCQVVFTPTYCLFQETST